MIRNARLIGLIVILSGFFGFCMGQTGKIAKGDSYYRSQQYARAQKYYEKAFKRDTLNSYVIRQLADIELKNKHNKEAVNWYGKLVRRSDCVPKDYLDYAKTLCTAGRYDESAFWLLRYNERAGFPEDGKAFSRELAATLSLLRDTAAYEIEPLGINTQESDMTPTIVDGKLVFCSAGRQLNGPSRKTEVDEDPYMKLFISDILPDGQLAQPKLFAPTLKSQYHDGPIAYAAKADEIFITHNSIGVNSDNRKRFVNLKIQKSKREAGRWSSAVDLPFNSTRWSVAHPATNAAGSLLIFVSDNPDGMGENDLYITSLVRGGWTNPENMGPTINTPGNEVFPYLANDSTLYFSSDGFSGLGGIDIYKSISINGVFQAPQNVGSPINSAYDDFGMALTGDGFSGYFTSNRIGGVGKDDIYSFKRISFTLPVLFQVRDSESKKYLPLADITVRTEQGDTLVNGLTDTNGLTTLELPAGKKLLAVVSHDGYTHQEFELNFAKEKAGTPQELALSLDFNPVKAEESVHPLFVDIEDGQQIQILDVYAIHYDLAKSTIRPDAYEVLNPLINYLSEHPELEVRIESHADSRGKREMNQKLSDNRARILNNYFVSHYIRPERIRYKGFGESRLLNLCIDGVNCSDDEHSVNRRSVIKIVRKGAYDGMRVKRSAFYF